MPPMLLPLMIVWASLVGLLIVLLIYRSTLIMHEDDQLFLTDSESYLKEEQDDLQRRMSRIRPFVTAAQVGCGALTLVIGGIWLWDMYKHF